MGKAPLFISPRELELRGWPAASVVRPWSGLLFPNSAPMPGGAMVKGWISA